MSTHTGGKDQLPVARRRSEFEKGLRRFGKNTSGMVGLALVTIVVVLAAAAPLITRVDPNRTDVTAMFAPPSVQHPFGTDNLGRDQLSRALFGARVSVLVALAVVGVTTITGPVLGFLAGFYRRLDAPLMRLVDILMAVPAILLALAVVAVMGLRIENVIIALAIPYTASPARVVRSVVLQLKEKEFIEAARTIGASDLRIIIRHLLPNSLPPLIVVQTFTLAVTVLAESSLSFLGVGVPPEIPTLGSMIAATRNYLQAYPWLPLFPGAGIFLFVLGANLLGDGFRDVLDPMMRS